MIPTTFHELVIYSDISIHVTLYKTAQVKNFLASYKKFKLGTHGTQEASSLFLEDTGGE